MFWRYYLLSKYFKTFWPLLKIKYNFCNQNSITIKLLLYHPKANPIKDVYAALMRRQMQWSHLISDKWAPRFHSLWSRSSFLVSTFHLFFLSKKPCVWSLFSPSNLSWGSKNTTLSRNYLWEKLLTTCAHNVGKSFLNSHFCFYSSKVEKVSNCSLDSPSVQIQIMSGKVCLRCKVKTMLGVVYKLLKTKSNVLPLHLKQI